MENNVIKLTSNKYFWSISSTLFLISIFIIIIIEYLHYPVRLEILEKGLSLICKSSKT